MDIMHPKAFLQKFSYCCLARKLDFEWKFFSLLDFISYDPNIVLSICFVNKANQPKNANIQRI